MSVVDKLPRELLDRVVDIALVQDRDHWDIPSADIVDYDLSRIAHKRNQNAFCAWSYGPPNVLWEDTTYVSNAAPLLLVNRFFYESTKAAVDRLANSDEGLVYKLDVMLVHERAIWPTWICVPALSTVVGRVEVTMRVVGSHETARAASDKFKIYSGLLGGDGGPPQLLWCFYYLMEHYLKRGPRPMSHSEGDIDRGIVTRRIEVNFQRYDGPLELPDASTQAAWWRSRRAPPRVRVEPTQLMPMRPEWLMEFLLDRFGALLAMGYHTAKYGGIIYERIGSIQFSTKGDDSDDPHNLKREYDLGKILQRVDYNDPTHTFGHFHDHKQRLPAFKAWKEHALQQREQYRLDVASDSRKGA